MSWQAQVQGYEDMSFPPQAAYNPHLQVQSGQYYVVTDLENQPVHYQPHYSPHPIPSSGNVSIYPTSDFTDIRGAEGFVQGYQSSYAPQHSSTMNHSFDRNPVGLNFVPGMPLPANHFETAPFDLLSRENSHNSDKQMEVNSTQSRGRGYHQQLRGRGKNNRFQGYFRGRSGYRNAHGYYNYGSEQNYVDRDRDNYHNEPPHYGYGTQYRRGHAEYGADGRRGKIVPQHFQTWREPDIGNGDGKPHKKRNYESRGERQNPRSADKYGSKSDTQDVDHCSDDMQGDISSSGQSSYKSEKQGENTQVATAERKSHNKYSEEAEEQCREENARTNHRINHKSDQNGRSSRNSKSRNESYSGKYQKEKESVNSQLRQNNSVHDEYSSERGRGNYGNRGRNGNSGAGHRFSDGRGSKHGGQVHMLLENDESQRGSLTEQLSSNKYECMVCCDNVRVEASVWSCQKCFHVFHLSCIQKWAQSSICKDTRSWRCPGCQNVSSHVPSQYRCFCGRRRDPKYIRGEIPHSCGDTCRRRRADGCKHPCTILCHPGPCPPCSSTVWITCDCGKVRKNVRCSAAVNFKCSEVCNKLLTCQEHKCQEMCHSGPCPSCAISKTQECFCKKTSRKAMCGTEEFKMIAFNCEKPCGRTLACGNHVCEEECHPGDCAPCALMPGNLKTCSCGKTPLSELKAPERYSCLDAVPTCGQVCNKPMSCGSPLQPHLCDKKCHEGDCGPCSQETQLRCECGATEKKIPCEVAVTFNEQNPFKCQRRCGKKKTCGRHKCSDNCCVKDIHICEIVCGQKLSCGMHKCEELCHRGNCKRCLQASFEELTCCCGAEVLEPPVPCGTKPPECRRLCIRQHDCDHPVRHNCHGDEHCPPCTELTDKMCVGGHMMRKNVPCHMTNISCGYPCNKLLPCGEHKCTKSCHKGDCLEEGATCSQTCLKTRPACGHPCGAPCHSGECPDVPCKTEITITCPCGNRSAKAQCSLGGDLSADIAQFQRLSVQTVVESGGQGVDLSQFTQSKKSNKRLDCDANCGIMERNRRMALALEIKNPDMSAKLGNATYSDFLRDFAKKTPKFAMSVEKSLNDLVLSAKQSAHPNRSHPFHSMSRDQRRFVHELAECYGCQTQSYDFEPNKNVVATAAKDKCWLPNGTLSQVVLKDQLPKAPPPISTFRKQGVTCDPYRAEIHFKHFAIRNDDASRVILLRGVLIAAGNELAPE